MAQCPVPTSSSLVAEGAQQTFQSLETGNYLDIPAIYATYVRPSSYSSDACISGLLDKLRAWQVPPDRHSKPDRPQPCLTRIREHTDLEVHLPQVAIHVTASLICA